MKPLVDGQLFHVEASASLGNVFRLTKVAEQFDDILNVSSAVSAGSSHFGAGA